MQTHIDLLGLRRLYESAHGAILVS